MEFTVIAVLIPKSIPFEFYCSAIIVGNITLEDSILIQIMGLSPIANILQISVAPHFGQAKRVNPFCRIWRILMEVKLGRVAGMNC